jgi:hypothetical protein
VRTYNASGDSDYSNESFATTADTVPPAKVEDLDWNTDNIKEYIILTWTAVGDNGNEGQAVEYDIKAHTDIITDNNWDSIGSLKDLPVPKKAGEKESFKVNFSDQGLDPDKRYCFRMKVKDEAGNWSELSNQTRFTCIYVYPIPFVPARGHKEITFFGSGIPYATIKIYNKAGELVKIIREERGESTIHWDVTNDQGEPLASGVYIWISESPKESNRGKIAIIR